MAWHHVAREHAREGQSHGVRVDVASDERFNGPSAANRWRPTQGADGIEPGYLANGGLDRVTSQTSPIAGSDPRS